MGRGHGDVVSEGKDQGLVERVVGIEGRQRLEEQGMVGEQRLHLGLLRRLQHRQGSF